ncbi:YhjD/YihY/BrkB family envelope integrity protein [uncultured Jatrophihabitans sp.]|uniref:YhjD/YihY/BrkB family envelope integrity protein n=1 Tax=uncultured Jatrophihabitans sp. TaxID=1610747 RepID=UPI0035C959C3
MTDEAPGRISRTKSAASARWAALKERRHWVRHVVAAWHLMQRNNGNQYAAAITYFSFLALFPLLLLAVAIAGFVLNAHPAAEQSLFAHLTSEVPGGFGDTLETALKTAIANRSGVGVVGLIGVLLTGLGWIGNLRGAIDGVWGRPPRKQSFVSSRLANLLVLGGLGLGLLVSLGLTVAGVAVTDQILQAVHLDSVPGVRYLVKVIGIALAVGGDMVIFWWLLVRLPQAGVSRSLALRGALLASVGFEVLKIVGTYTIAKTSSSPTAGPFAGIVAVLVWIQLVARYMLFSCAWLATAHAADRAANSVPILEPAAMADQADGVADGDSRAVSPAAVGATLLGAGAAAGAAATWALTRSARAAPKPPGE